MRAPRRQRRGAVTGAMRGSGMALAMLLASAPLAAPAHAQSRSVAGEVRAEVDGKLKPFYRERNYYPLWVQDGTIGPQAEALIALIESADLDGLDPRDYDPDDLRRTVDEARGGSPRALAQAELKLSRALADYVADVRRPPSVKIVYLDQALVPESPSRVAVLRAAAAAPSLADYIAKQGWMNPVYAQLRAGLAEYRDQWADLPAAEVPAGPLLKPGAKGERVHLLRARLGLADGGYDKVLAGRVRAFQAAHGLPADGVAGARTIEAINRPSDYYERTIRLNMERARVLPGARERYILVDVASQRLWAYDDGELKDSMKVIVGKPTEQTPMLAGLMRYAIVNPYWNVPPDLVVKRIAPRGLAGETLAHMGFEALSDWTADARVLRDDEIDWRAVADGREQLRVRQLPGGSNAMGRMKFMFPNDLGIYLHDTPEKELFKKDVRQFSSGCVRLEDAPRLAQWLFGHPLTVGETPEQQVPLDRPVPVYLTYLTAAPSAGGIAFRDDAYGRDAAAERYASR